MSSALESEVRELRGEVAELKAMLGAALELLKTRERRSVEPAPPRPVAHSAEDEGTFAWLKSKKKGRRR